MRKTTYTFILFAVFFTLIGCKEKATPEMIERYEACKKQKELFYQKYNFEKYFSLNEEYNFHNVSDRYRFYYDDKEIVKKYYYDWALNELFYKLDDFLITDYSAPEHPNLIIDFQKLLNSDHRLATFLNTCLSDHKKYHMDLIPGTDEWNLWMMELPYYESKDDWLIREKVNPLAASFSGSGMYYTYEIDNKGKYNPKKSINPITQTCPFCVYKDEQFRKNGKIEEFKNWDELYLFTSDFSYWQDAKKYLYSDKLVNKSSGTKLNNNTEKLEIITFDNIRKTIEDNRLNAKDKYNGKKLKIKGQITSIHDDKVELLYGPYVFLPKEDLKKLHAGDYITFTATMKFFDYSSGNSNSSGFEKWARDLDDALNDLDKAIGDLDSGALGYSFENAKLEKSESGELPVFY